MSKLSNKTYESLKESVACFLEQYNLDKYPLDPFKILKLMDCEVIKISSFSEEIQKTMLKISDDAFTIFDKKTMKYKVFYNDKKIMERIRHSLAHEIGHIFLKHKEFSSLSEKIADFFAKYLLAPPPLIDCINNVTPRKLKKIFGISLESAKHSFDHYNNWSIFGRNKSYDSRILKQIKLIKY